jgi:uncharacterized protein (TIGR02147 family)
MIFAFNDYKAFLRQVLTDRIRKNPSYSLRSFAKQLFVSPSVISDVFSGRRHLSLQSGLKIGQKLGLDPEEREYLNLLIQFATAKDDGVKRETLERMNLINEARPIRNLDLDAFKMISDWYHIPIIEMSNLPKTQMTSKRIAKRLGITPLEAEKALERLLRLSILEKDATGRYVKTYTDGLFSSEQAHLGLQQFHGKMLEKAAASLLVQKPSERYIGSETFCFTADQLQEFSKLANKFFSRAVNLSRKTEKKSDVYHLGVQFFPVTRGEEI